MSAAIPCSPRALSKLIKFLVTWEPKKATFGPKTSSAITETAKSNIPTSKNLLKYFVIVLSQLDIKFSFRVNYPNLCD